MHKQRITADRLRQDKYRIFNKELAHYIGLNETIYLMYLIDCDNYINQGNVGEPFYKQQYYIFYETSLKEDTIRRINKKFVEMNLIMVEKVGLPAKNYFRINYDVVEKILNEAIDHFQFEIKTAFLQKQEKDDGSSDDLSGTSSRNFKGLDPVISGNIINNKEINNNTLLLHNNGENENDINMEVLVGEDQNISTPEPQPAEKKKSKGGIAPLFDLIDCKYPDNIYNGLNGLLKSYIHAYIGRRRLPSIEAWEEMLNKLWDYSTVHVPGTVGEKMNKAIAIKIVQKALDGKDGIPFLEFDDLYGYGKNNNVMEPQFNLNQDFTKGY